MAHLLRQAGRGRNSSLVFSAVAALLVAVSAGAQATPSITATLGLEPDSYLVTVRGFEPGATVYVNEISCGSLPCGAGPRGGFQQVVVPEDGVFLVHMQLLTDFLPHPGVTWRLIAAYQAGWTQAQIDAAPTVRIPLHHDGVAAPAAGNSPADAEKASSGLNGALAVGLAAGLLATAMAGFGRRRHRASHNRIVRSV
jgi:hypothetical protein